MSYQSEMCLVEQIPYRHKQPAFHQHQGFTTHPLFHVWPFGQACNSFLLFAFVLFFLTKIHKTISELYTDLWFKYNCFKAALRTGRLFVLKSSTQCMKPLEVVYLKLWQFKGNRTHNIFRIVQSKVSVLVPLHVYSLKQTRMQHISFGTAGEDNVEPWLV